MCKKFAVALFLFAALGLTVTCTPADAYVYLSVTGTNVNVRDEAKMGSKVLTQANLNDTFIAEDKPVINPADGSEWYKIVMIVGEDNEPLPVVERLSVAAAYINSGFVYAMKLHEDEEKRISGLLAGAAAGVTKTRTANANTIKVSNAKEFVEALGSNRAIEMDCYGDYNLSEISHNGLKLQEGIWWSSVFDGIELVVSEIENLTISGNGPEGARAEIIVNPRYAFVMKFEDCSNIVLEEISAGHSEGGECEGGVFSFTDSSQIAMNRVRMYGCGTEGLTLSNVSGMEVTDSGIYNCTDSIMTVTGGENISFEDCMFSDNGGYTLVNVSGTGNMSFMNCYFNDNRGQMFGVNNTTIFVLHSSFNRNNTDYPIDSSRNVKFTNSVFN